MAKTAVAAPVASRSMGWLNRFLVLFAIGLVVWLAAEALVSIREIPVQKIEVEGRLQHVSREKIEAIVYPLLAGGFLATDLQSVQQELERLPWVYRANVRRRWPSTLEIRLQEQLPIARWGSDGFLNHEGLIFRSANADHWSSLPQLSGPTGTAPRLVQSFQMLNVALAAVGLRVQSLELDALGEMQVILNQGTSLVLGRRHIGERLKRFVRVYESQFLGSPRQPERVDLRYETGLAVKMRAEPDALDDGDTVAAVDGVHSTKTATVGVR